VKLDRVHLCRGDEGVDGDGHPFVEVEQEARNQYGDLSARGTGTVWLPAQSSTRAS
jgi:hypothetical protein